MAFLFWLLWTIDLLLVLLGVVGKGFKDSFHNSGDAPWLLILLTCCTIGGFVLRVFFKRTLWGLALAALPLLVMLIWYFIEKNQNAIC